MGQTWNEPRLRYSRTLTKEELERWIAETEGVMGPAGPAQRIGKHWKRTVAADIHDLEREDFEAEGEWRKVPHLWALRLLCYYQRKFTPKQAQALHLTYVEQITQEEAAGRLGISRESYRDRLHAAREHATAILRAEVRADGLRPSEVRRGRNLGR